MSEMLYGSGTVFLNVFLAVVLNGAAEKPGTEPLQKRCIKWPDKMRKVVDNQRKQEYVKRMNDYSYVQ